MGSLSQLRILLLESNNLSGSIPYSLSNLTSLSSSPVFTDIGYNALYTNDTDLLAFLNSKDPDWANTQTIAPEVISATPTSISSVKVSWDPIVYTSESGGYKVFYSTTSGGPWTEAGVTSNKIAFEYDVTGLNYGTTYYFVVQTWTDPHSNNVNTVLSDYSNEVFATTSIPPNPPLIAISKTQFYFGYTIGSVPPLSQSFTITNSGGGTLNWTASCDSQWLSVNPMSGTGGAVIDISVDPSGLSVGIYTGTIAVSDPNATNSPQTVSVQLVVESDLYDLAVRSTPGTGVFVTVSPNDSNGKGDGNTNFKRTYNNGTVVTLTAPETFNNKIFQKWTIDGNDKFSHSIQVTMAGNHTASVVYQSLAGIGLSRNQFNFGFNRSGISTGPQGFFISNSGESTLNWTVSDNASWIKCSPEKGADFGEVTISVNGLGLPTGAYFGEIMISAPNALNSPQRVYVTFIIDDSHEASVPFGFFETPADGSTVSGSVPVTGWTLDDIEVENVKIYRNEGSGLAYIGDAVFVEGARPDVEQAYSNYPKCYQAGWGYLMLTNSLPNQGNGIFTIYAKTADKEGNIVTLGTKTIKCDNANAVKPFGAFDTPAQGGTASGRNYINWGWVLTPQPNSIPTDGSTISVYVDGVNLGHPVYNIYRSDIANLFPNYANSNGAVGYFYIDTTIYENGLHTIQWVVSDDAGNTDGIGSRYFNIRNSAQSTAHNAIPPVHNTNRITPDPGFVIDASVPVGIIKGYNREAVPGKPGMLYPTERGMIKIEIKELERIELRFSSSGQLSGWMVVGDRFEPLPIGSYLDQDKGIFYWQTGPGFVGEYRLVFIEEDQYGNHIASNIVVKIKSKF